MKIRQIAYSQIDDLSKECKGMVKGKVNKIAQFKLGLASQLATLRAILEF